MLAEQPDGILSGSSRGVGVPASSHAIEGGAALPAGRLLTEGYEEVSESAIDIA